MPAYQKTVLKNGLRVITERRPSVRSIALGVWIDVGSRYEAPSVNGISHLIEHMVFKGTKRRTAKQIASSLESVGGVLNAFTSREQTCFNARIIDEHLPDAVDILADICCHPSVTPVNLKREKLVICEEIKEAVETPSDLIHDLFSQTFWNGHALGQPVLGSIDNVLGMSRAQILKYMRQHYRTESIVIAAVGNIKHENLVELVRKKFRFEKGRSIQSEPAPEINGTRIKHAESDAEQVHFCLGYPGLSFDSPERTALMLLTTHLGGGMSSTLFQKVREDRGLAYTIYAFHDAYRDAGVFGIYMATDKTRLAEAYEVVVKELRSVRRRRFPSARLEQIKRQVRGQISLSLESTVPRMSRLARNELMLGSHVTLARTLKKIEAVTASQLLELANRIIDDNKKVIVTLGPVDRKAFQHVAGSF